MPPTDKAIIGVEKCGCVTLAIASPRNDDTWQRKAITEAVSRGANIVHTTVGAAKRRKNFLPVECPHDPKGWEADVDAA